MFLVCWLTKERSRCSSLHLGVVAIGKGNLELPSTTLLFYYLAHCLLVIWLIVFIDYLFSSFLGLVDCLIDLLFVSFSSYLLIDRLSLGFGCGWLLDWLAIWLLDGCKLACCFQLA